MPNKHKLILVLAAWLWTMAAAAQTTRVSGVVRDTASGEPLPFVEVSFVGTTIGTTTDIDGRYTLQTAHASDTLRFTMMGFRMELRRVVRSREQTIDVMMSEDQYQLSEVVILPGENPAWPIMRRVAAHRRGNNPDRFQGYRYEVYNKTELDLHVPPNMNMANLGSFGFVGNYVEKTDGGRRAHLPLFLSENLSEVSRKKNPARFKEVIKGSSFSGVENSTVAQYTGQMYLDVNIYDNLIPAFSREFVSPICDGWKLNYRYYLMDSTLSDGHMVYHLMFKPRRPQELTFEGDMWITTQDWAVKRIRARMSPDANINFVENFLIDEMFQRVDSVWFLVREQMNVDFALPEAGLRITGKRSMTRRQVEINPQFERGTFSPAASQESVIEVEANNRDSAYWNSMRPDRLSAREQGIYNMMDSIKQDPVFQGIEKAAKFLTTGYWAHGPLEYGPWSRLYSYNKVEGHRFRLGLRTTKEFSQRLKLGTYAAYGTRDHQLKGGVSALYVLGKLPRRALSLNYKYDYEQLGRSITAFSEDNILSTLLSRRPRTDLMPLHELRGSYEHEYFQGISNTFEASWRLLRPTQYLPFANAAGGQEWSGISSMEASVSLHFAYNEKFVAGDFYRTSTGSKAPIMDMKLTCGSWSGLPAGADDQGGWHSYGRLMMTMRHSVGCGMFGKLKYTLEGGKIWGTVPYPLLKMHEGNGTYLFDRRSYNMMNPGEFASDQYVSLRVEQHLGGLLLNHLPLIRRLKWREIIYAKGLAGSISPRNYQQAVIDLPESMGGVQKPYLEAGIGIENIFRFFRLDAVWRLTHRDNPDARNFAVMLGAEIVF